MASTETKSDFLQISLIFCISIYLRLTLIGRDIFTDEAFSYFYSLKPISFIIGINDVHPPLYHIYLKPFAAILGNNLPLLRLSTLLLWICLFWAIYALLVRLWDIKAAKYALLLLSISPTMIYYSTELRMYMLGMLFVTLSFIAYYNLISKNTSWWGFIYALTILGMGLTHFLTLPVVAVQLAYLLWKKELNENWLLPISCSIGIVVVAILTKIKITALHFVKPTLISLISSFTFMWSYPHKNLILITLPIAALIIGLIGFKVKLPDGKAWLFLSLCIVPIGFWILSQYFVIYHHRFFLFEALGAYIFIAYAIHRLKITEKNDLHYAVLGLFIISSIFTIGCNDGSISYGKYDNLKNMTNGTIVTDNTFEFFVNKFYTQGHDVKVYLNTTLNSSELFSYGGNVLEVSDFYNINGENYMVAGYVVLI